MKYLRLFRQIMQKCNHHNLVCLLYTKNVQDKMDYNASGFLLHYEKQKEKAVLFLQF